MSFKVLSNPRKLGSQAASFLLPHPLCLVRYGPTLGFPINLLPLNFHSRGILVYHSYYTGKATNFFLEIKCIIFKHLYICRWGKIKFKYMLSKVMISWLNGNVVKQKQKTLNHKGARQKGGMWHFEPLEYSQVCIQSRKKSSSNITSRPMLLRIRYFVEHTNCITWQF